MIFFLFTQDFTSYDRVYHVSVEIVICFLNVVWKSEGSNIVNTSIMIRMDIVWTYSVNLLTTKTLNRKHLVLSSLTHVNMRTYYSSLLQLFYIILILGGTMGRISKRRQHCRRIGVKCADKVCYDVWKRKTKKPRKTKKLTI